MSKAYVIISGEHSFREVRGVFLDKAEAEEYVNLWNSRRKGITAYDRMEIEEYEVGEIDRGVYPDNKKEGHFSAYLRPNVAFLSMESSTITRKGTTHTPSVVAREHEMDEPMMEIFFEGYHQGPPCMNIPYSVAKDDPEVAKKIFTDALAKYDAEQEGISV